MSRDGCDCCFKQTRFNKLGNPYKIFKKLINRDLNTKRPYKS